MNTNYESAIAQYRNDNMEVDFENISTKSEMSQMSASSSLYSTSGGATAATGAQDNSKHSLSSSSKGFEWTKEQEVRMCQMWKEELSLYDTKSPHFKDKVTRTTALYRISVALSISVEEIEKKQRYLRTQYGKLVNRIQHTPSSATAKEKKLTSRKSGILEMCAFLNGHIKIKAKESNIKSTIKKAPLKKDKLKKSATAKAVQAKKIQRKAINVPNIKSKSKKIKLSKKEEPKAVNDEDATWAKLLLLDVAKMEDRAKAKFRRDVSNLVYAALE